MRMLNTVVYLSYFKEGNTGVLFEAGMLPVILRALAAHGVADPAIASKACMSLLMICEPSRARIDDVALAPGALDLIFAAMDAHVGNYDVQRHCCWLLWAMGQYGSPAVIAALRESRALIVSNQAVRAHRVHVYERNGLRRRRCFLKAVELPPDYIDPEGNLPRHPPHVFCEYCIRELFWHLDLWASVIILWMDFRTYRISQHFRHKQLKKILEITITKYFTRPECVFHTVV